MLLVYGGSGFVLNYKFALCPSKTACVGFWDRLCRILNASFKGIVPFCLHYSTSQHGESSLDSQDKGFKFVSASFCPFQRLKYLSPLLQTHLYSVNNPVLSIDPACTTGPRAADIIGDGTLLDWCES